jgi:hypothetical protein
MPSQSGDEVPSLTLESNNNISNKLVWVEMMVVETTSTSSAVVLFTSKVVAMSYKLTSLIPSTIE